MAEVIRMPRMSDTMTEGTFVEWHKKVGDAVKSGDILAEVETDKATMELENYVKGTLLYIGVEKGQSAKVDQIIAIVGKEGEDFQALLKDEKPEVKTEEPKEEAAKEKVEEPKKEEPKAEESADAKTDEIKTEEPKKENKQEETVDPDSRLKASPLAKKMAEEKGIDIQVVTGSGDGGRIVKRDVENFVPQKKEAVKESEQKQQVVINIPQYVGEESFEEVPVSQMRKTIAKRLTESKFTSPHFYLTISVDMDRAMEVRKSLNEIAQVKISFNDLIVKACAMSLRLHPAVNSSWLGDKIRFNKHIHIGVAVAINDGLVVPVIRFADNKSLTAISVETTDLADRARNKKLQPTDWEGNTFTISNLGMMGIEEFTAIINPPDACILAVGGINQVPVVKNGEIKIGNVMKLTMSCDHRVVDGAVGARFLQTLKQFIEDPARMLL